MTATKNLGGTFTFSGTSITVHRLGYGAMQLAGPNVFGPPKDTEAALRVLRNAVDAGINHIDTSDIYGPHVTNQLIQRALHPYPQNLTIATKVGSRRGEDGSWIPDRGPANLRSSVEDNLRNLKLDSLHLVNLRVGELMGPTEGSIAEPLSVLESMQRDGLIQHIGLSNVSPRQYEAARESRTSFAYRTTTTSPIARTILSSTSLRLQAWPMFHFFPWEAVSRYCNRQPWMRLQLLLNRPHLRSLWRGCYSAGQMSC